MTRADLASADRDQLARYLEQWGFAVYDHESVETLRETALQNFDTEGG